MEQTEEGIKAKQETKKSKFEEKEEGKKQEFQLDYQREHAIAYLIRKMPYHYYIFKRIIHEIHQRLPDFQPKSVLDFGAGLGSGLWAA